MKKLELNQMEKFEGRNCADEALGVAAASFTYGFFAGVFGIAVVGVMALGAAAGCMMYEESQRIYT